MFKWIRNLFVSNQVTVTYSDMPDNNLFKALDKLKELELKLLKEINND